MDVRWNECDQTQEASSNPQEERHLALISAATDVF